MAQLIQPRTLKGFRDFLPNQMLAREHLLETARRVYRSYGFVPIDTPTLEYAEILAGKGGDESDKQMFRFTDSGGRDVAMRFDLTVPFARYAAQHIGKLGTPFKRYHIGTVFRGENTQRGRYREFMQCDFDTIGTSSLQSDIETLFVIHDLFEALGFDDFTIRLNNRMVLNGLLETQGLREKSVAVLRVLDKLLKIGREKVVAELESDVGMSSEQVEAVLSLTDAEGSNEELLTAVEPHVSGCDEGAEGIAQLRELLSVAASGGLPTERTRLDLTIARGLDYYTGTIFETFLGALPNIGSVCSGGRYDNLAGLYTKQELPGVGASLGLDRLLAAMEELGQVESSSASTDVLITIMDADRLGDYFAIGRRLRAAGIACEVCPKQTGLGKQLKFADGRGIRFAVIAGADEFAEGTWQVKDLEAGEQEKLTVDELITFLEGKLG